MEQVDPGQAPTLANYQLRLPAYEGPLDVLLRLIERSRLAIEDVSLVAVTGQFLDFVSSLDRTEPAVIAEFAAVGARLTVLKSRSLLPRPIVEDEEAEQSDLTHQLREYKRVRDLARRLGHIHASGHVAHVPGGNLAAPRTVELAPLRAHDVTVLVRALRRRLTVVPRKPTIIRHRHVVSIREVIGRISSLMGRAATIRFSALVTPYCSRTEVATAFLAVLVLVRREAIEAHQGDLFADFQLVPGPADDAGLEQPIDEFIN